MGCWATAMKREWLEKNTWEKTALLQHFCKDTLSWNVRGELTNLNVTGLSGFRFHLKIFTQPSSQSLTLCLWSLWKHKLNCLGVSRTSLVFNLR